MMILFSSQTGLIEALLLDKGYLTGIRTALAGALAAENLANPEIKTVGIIGAGAQARPYRNRSAGYGDCGLCV